MNSLPFLTRLIAATILTRQNKTLIAEIVYLRTEIAYLHERIPAGSARHFTDRWREQLARAAAGVGWKRLAEIATVAKAAAMRGWHRLMLTGKLSIKRRSGRPRTNAELEMVVVRLACENPSWGQARIRGELLKLGVCLGARTIAAILGRHGMKPAPDRSMDWTWERFISTHLHELAATDFFTVDVAGRGWNWFRSQTAHVPKRIVLQRILIIKSNMGYDFQLWHRACLIRNYCRVRGKYTP
jgi:hypothetical protein